MPIGTPLPADAIPADAAGAPREASHGAAALPAPSAPASTGAMFAFDDLLADVAEAIESSLPPWKIRLGEAAARWQGEGIDTGIIERALRLAQAPDVDALLATFDAAVGRLRALEREAAALDAGAARDALFRAPARVAEAQALVTRLRAARAASPALRIDAETWVAEWPDVVGLLIEDA